MPQDELGFIHEIWETEYPFDYWWDRIERIDGSSALDEMDALFVLSHLADTYATIISAKLRNPENVWYLVKEESMTYEMNNILDKIKQDNGTYHLEKVLDGPEGILGIELPDEWLENNDRGTIFATSFLGLPYEIGEDKTIEPRQNPIDYVAISNSVLTYWNQTTHILNDFKHGFRIIPFGWHIMEKFEKEGALEKLGYSIEDLKQNFPEVDADWTFDFLRMGSDSSDSLIQLEVYTARIQIILTYCKTILKLLYNLFNNDSYILLEDELQDLGQQKMGTVVPLIQQQFEMDIKYQVYDPSEL